jgi:hypothetical protein
MVFAWPERPSAIPAEKSVDVPDGMEALAFCGTERDEEHRALQKSWWSRLRSSESLSIFGRREKGWVNHHCCENLGLLNRGQRRHLEHE